MRNNDKVESLFFHLLYSHVPLSKAIMYSLGFSLFELLIAMFITAILATVGIASWRDMQARSELSATTIAIVQFLNDVKTDANFYNYNQYVYLIQLNRTGWCLNANTDSILPNDCNSRFQFMPQYDNIAFIGLSTGATFIFYGRRSTAKAMTLRLKNSIGESRIIISVPGRIRYCSYHTHLAGFPKC